MRFSIFALLASAIVVTTPVCARDVSAAFSATEGKVFLKQDDNTVLATIFSRLGVGNKVIVGIDASAQLAMSGCDIFLAPGANFVIPEVAPCGKGEVFHVDGVQFTPANGTSIADAAVVHGANSGLMLAAGGLAAAAIVGFAVLSQNDEETDAASAH